MSLAALVCVGCSRAPAPGPESARGPGLGPIRMLPTPAASGSGEPRLSIDSEGLIVLSWLEPSGPDGELALRYSRLRGEEWTAAAVASRGHDWIVSAADLPSVRWLSDQVLVADWRVPGTDSPYAYDIEVAVSADAGATWSAPLRLNDDATPSEHGFVSWFRAGDRNGAVWLDGRDGAGEELVSNAGAPLGTSLRYAYLDDAGRMLSQGVIDELVCDCCRTDLVRSDAGVAVIYRDRSPEEIRDIAVRVGTATGWSGPVTLGPDGWQIEGCPVNGPAIDAVGNEVAAAWFTAADGRGRVRFARSRDGGASFGAAVDIDADGAIGQVGVALTPEGTAFVSWWRRAATGGAQLAVRSVGGSGELAPLRVVASTAASRPESVPQLVRSGGRLVFAWTDEDDAAGAVAVAYAELGEGI